MKRLLAVTVTVLAVVLALEAVAQEPLRIELDLLRGLADAVPESRRGPSDAQQAVNIDFVRYPGYIAPRAGYAMVTRLGGIDSIAHGGLFTARYTDGNSRMFVYAYDSSTATCVLYASELNRPAFSGVLDKWNILFSTTRDQLCPTHTQCYTLTYSINAPLSGSPCTYTAYYAVPDTTTVTPGMIAVGIRSDIEASACTSGISLSYIVTPSADTMLSIGEASTDVGLSVMPRSWDSVEYVPTGSGIPVASGLPAPALVQWAQLHDRLYVTNAVGKMLVVIGNSVQWFPPPSPSEPLAIPTDASGPLFGRYRYVVQYSGDSVLYPGHRDRFGYITTPIQAESVLVQLTHFPPPQRNAVLTTAEDTATVRIWRTVGQTSSAALSVVDTFWLVGTIFIDSTSYATASFTDTMSDITLRTQPSIIVSDSGRQYTYDPNTPGASSGTKYFRRPGAPTVVSYAARADSGIWAGASEDWDICAGYSYIAVFFDTLSRAFSDSSRSIAFLQKGKPTSYASDTTYNGDTLSFNRSVFSSVRIALPRNHTNNNNLRVVLYRAPIRPATYDSATTTNIEIVPQYNVLGQRLPDDTIVTTRIFCCVADSFYLGAYRYIGEGAPGDTITDTVSYADAEARPIYVRSFPPSTPSAVVAFDNRLIIADRGVILMSNVADTSIGFSALRSIPVNRDDGDRVTAIIPQRGVLKVAKSRRTYVMRKAGGSWALQELATNYGVTAPLSVARMPEGEIFLSNDGVRIESENIYRDYSSLGQLLSTSVAELRDMTNDVRSSAVAVFFRDRYWLSVPKYGWSFVMQRVLDESGRMRYPWSKWSIRPIAFAPMSFGKQSLFYRQDSLYFAMPGQPAVYVFGGSDKDSAKYIVQMQYLSGPLVPRGNVSWRPDEISIYYTVDNITPAVGPTGDTLNNWQWIYGWAIDTTGTTMDTLSTFPGAETRYRIEMPPLQPSNLVSWYLWTHPNVVFQNDSLFSTGILKVQNVELLLRPVGEVAYSRR